MSFILINKPKKMTSHDVVYQLRKVTGEKRIGHAGTLDPEATGLMILGITRESTKKLGVLTTGLDKTYIAGITLGEERDTLDAEGKIISTNSEIKPTKEEVEKVVNSFLGKQKQIPPIYSALKLNGKKAYELARAGKVPEMKERDIEIFEIQTLKYGYPTLELKVRVTAGTYIRSLAHDIGKKLVCGAYLSSLVRTKIGEFDLENSHNLSDLDSQNWKEKTFDI